MWNNDAYIHYYYKLQVTSYVITAETDRERILKIGQHLPKLWERIKFPVFFTHWIGYMKSIWYISETVLVSSLVGCVDNAFPVSDKTG